jgi:hypothetical protein
LRQYCGRTIRGQGLKLGQAIQGAADRNNVYATTFVQSATKLRKSLDELSGISRYVDDTVDPYSRLVFETPEGLTTGRANRLVTGDQILENGTYIPKREIQQAGKGITKEPASIWTYRDELQQSLIKQARRLPYELPALYISQRAFVDPLFGNNQDRKKVKWYNPVDVLADFAKQSTINIAAITGTGAAGSAVLSRSKFYLNAPYASNPNLELSAKQLKLANRFADAKVVLEEFGHDLGNLSNQISRFTSSASGAFNLSLQEAQKNTQSPGQVLHAMRHGAKRAANFSNNSNLGKNKTAGQKAKAFFLGEQVGDYNYAGFIDLLPGMKGFSTGFKSFGENFRTVKKGYDVVSGAIGYDDAINAIKKGPTPNAADRLEEAINIVKSQHKSNFSAFSDSVHKAMGPGGPGNLTIDRTSFARNVQEQEYRKQLAKHLIHNNTDKKTAQEFANQIRLGQIPGSSKRHLHVSERIGTGKSRIIAETDDDFYDQLSMRFRKQVGDEVAPNPDVIKRSIQETDLYLTRKEFNKSFDIKKSSMWNTFYNENVVPYGHTVFKPQKAVYQDFVGPLTSAKEEFLRRRTAQILGVKLTGTNGRDLSNKIVNNELKKRGFDVDNFGQLRAFLIQNKAMTSQSSSGGTNLFGMKQLLVDEAFERGIFAHLPQGQRDIIQNLAGRLKLDDPVSKSIGFSKLDGVYQNKNGEIVDLTRIKSMVTGIGNFIANEFHIPIVKFNPLQMMGVGGPSGVNKMSPFITVPGKSVQSFGGLEAHAADVFVWTKAKNGIFGPKGTLSYLSENEFGEVTSKKVAGLFRPINTRESNIFTRAASYASNRGASLRTAQIEASAAGKELSFIERAKKAFNVDEEQPNSLFRLASRFRRRKYDIDNPAVFGRLLTEDTIETGSRSASRKISLVTSQDGKYSVVNDSGKEVYDHKSVLKAFDTFRRSTQEYGMPLNAMKGIDDFMDLRINVQGRMMGISDVTSQSEMRLFAQTLGDMLEVDKASSKLSAEDFRALRSSYSRVSKLLDESDLTAVSSMAAKSPAISTRMDELRNEIFRYMLQRNTYLNAGGNPASMITAIDAAVNDLKKRGLISAAQVAEARAAGLSTILNMSSFRTFNGDAVSGNNISNALSSVRSAAKAESGAFNRLTSPFTQGTSSLIASSGFSKVTNFIKPTFKKKFGTADYQMDTLASNPLGGQSMAFVPTFGTAVENVGIRRALSSAAGLTTYKDPEAFSFSSVPISHGFERLNRYFGTLGLGLDASKYAGPIDLYARGMVGQRVLPIVGAGTAFVTADRTIGGFVNEKDERGERVYSPFLLGKAGRGVVEAQAAISGVVPGGMGYEEKKEQLLEGEVPIRQGRFWPLGTTPFEGGKVMYHRPSWYRRLQGGAMYTSDTFGSPVEKFLYGYDFSPLRAIDPYRYERKHYEDRPYPVTGEYFSGPFGPVTDFLNATAGRILKPQVRMHEDEVNAALSRYVPAGQSGAYNPNAILRSGRVFADNAVGSIYSEPGPGSFGQNQFGAIGGANRISQYNRDLASRNQPLGTARNISFNTISTANAGYVQANQFGPPPVPGIVPPQIVGTGTPISGANVNFQAGQVGYKLQETFGIYGFGFASLREGLGFGQGDFEPQRSVLQSAQKAYGSTRAFWDLNLGGLGDVPLTAEGALGNIEISEIVRRFVPKERTNVNYLNPIRNTMADQFPFLPGSNYFINFQEGDPYTKVQEGELRLPGVAYERFNVRAKGYDQLTQLEILSDVAPYSKEFRQLNRTIQMGGLDPGDRERLQELRDQVEQTTKRYEFTDYTYKNRTPEELGIEAKGYAIGRVGEYIAHRDTYFNTKFLQKRTAQEDWERRNVYGSTFPEWQRPFESFIEPMIYKATQRNPITAGAGLSIIGSLFGKTARARAVGAIAGFTSGMSFSLYGNAREEITGERFIPKERKKQLALEEYADILSYTKNTALASQAVEQGDMASANQFRQAARRTMYGADIYGSSVDTLSLAIPKRKREHFKAMIQETDQEERERILSTSGRLERRIYQSAWGMEVEQRPDLVEYFSRHELPGANWEGWHPNTNMEHVKIKMGQSMGINMSQMGYYPQQVREANLTNPSYPVFGSGQDEQNVAARLRELMSRNGIMGSVIPVMDGFGGSSAQISAGLVGSGSY